MAKFKLTKQEKSWVKYDVGNSAMFMMTSALIPIFFKEILAASGVTETGSAMVLWNNAVMISTVIVALLMPVLGSLADFKGNKKKFYIGFVGTGCVATIVLGLSQQWLLFLIIYVLAYVCLNSSLVFYDSFLCDVTTDDRMDNVSSTGYAWGYIGSCAPFIVCVAIYATQAMGILPISVEAVHISTLAITAVWWFAFSMPLFKNVEQTHFKEPDSHAISKAFKGLVPTLKEIAHNKAVLFYIIAYFFFIDGVHTIISEATIFGSELGIDSIQLVLALLVTQFVAFPSAIIYGRLASRYGTRKMLFVGIIGYTCITFYAGFFLYAAPQFWVLAVCVGMFQGGIQACSRSYYGKLIPKEKSNEYFGFFDIFGKGADIVGPALINVFVLLTGNMHYGVLSISILFVAGFIFLALMPKTDVDRVNLFEEAVDTFQSDKL